MSILSLFYRWAMEQGHAEAEPFTYQTARALFHGTGREVRVNLAVRRTPKPHVTIKYLEPDFTSLFRNGLRGLAPDGRTEPRFPRVHPHRLRHSFLMRTLEYLVSGHYRQAAKLVEDADTDAALVFYLSKAEPLLVLRDLLGHSSVLTTEKHPKRLDTTRIYRDAYEAAGITDGLLSMAAAEREADAEFDDESGLS